MKGKKTGGRNFKRGNPGGPGRPALPEEERALRKVTQTEFERIANKYLNATRYEIKAATNDPKMIALELVIVSVIHKAVVNGDGRMLELLLNRLIGKVAVSVEHSGPGGGAIPVRAVSDLSSEEVTSRLKKIQARMNRTLGHEK